MIYFDFLIKLGRYLGSVRILKDHVSFDLSFPKQWVMSKSILEGLSVVKWEDQQDTRGFSFVCKNAQSEIDKIELAIDKLIKFNKEREEKELLFRSKIQELKTIFEDNDVNELRALKFDINEIDILIQDDKQENEDREGITIGEESSSVGEAEK